MARPLPAASFPGAATHLNTASVGMPSRASVAALRRAADTWASGACQTDAWAGWVERSRAAYGQLVGVEADRVALAGTAAHVVGMTAASLPAGARVLCVEDDFTSVTGPFLADPRLRVTMVPFELLLDSIVPGVDLVAVSAVRSNDGRVLDLAAFAEAAATVGARTLVDATHGTGWLSLDASRFDVVVSAAYKWLLCPRGISFAAVREDADWLRPVYANWSATDDPWGSLYGPSLPLSDSARRFDSSPPWPLLESTALSLELLAEVGVERLGEHSVGLANAFRAELGMAESNSAIVSLPGDAAPLIQAGLAVANRDGRVRLSFYGYNSMAEVERAAAALGARQFAHAS